MSSATSRYVPSLLVVLTSSIICMRLSCSTSRHFLSSPRHAKGSSKNCAAKFSYHLDLYQPPSHPPIHCAPTQRPIPQDTERNRCTRHTTLFFLFWPCMRLATPRGAVERRSSRPNFTTRLCSPISTPRLRLPLQMPPPQRALRPLPQTFQPFFLNRRPRPSLLLRLHRRPLKRPSP